MPEAPEQPELPSALTRSCKNCGAALSGAFCVNCGQSADVHVPSTREIIHEAFEGITHSDSRLWNSLKLLCFAPGKLTREFIAGRRMAYLPPFRLYLVMSVIFFLIASISKDAKPDFDIGAPDKTPSERCSTLHTDVFASPNMDARLRHACAQIVRDHGENLMHVVFSTFPKAMFIFLPLIAFFHMLLYWFPRHRYAVHLLFFIHIHAFAFFALAVLLALSHLPTGVPALTAVRVAANVVIWVYLPIYILRAMRRVFRRRWSNVWLKAFVLSFIYLFVASFTVAGVFIYAMMQL